MRVAAVCFTLAGLCGLSAASLSLAQVTYQEQLCFVTPVPVCQNQCGCPISNASWDMCPTARPPKGQTQISFYYCVAATGHTCTSPNLSCGGAMSVVNCSTENPDGSLTQCGCCGGNTNPPCPNWIAQMGCWNCPDGYTCIPAPDKPGCTQLYGCTGT
jgi:hypothetical protein